MSDQYYDREDDVQETDETALANYNAAANSMVNFVPDAAADLNATSDALKQLWEKAPDAESQEQINQVWDIAQRAATRIGQLDAAHQLAATALEKISERRKQVQHEYDQINEALDDVETKGWSSHPRIESIVEMIEENAAGHDPDSGLYLECPGCEAANFWYDTPLDHDAVNDICYALFSPNAMDIPPALREELVKNINSFSKQWNEYLDAERARIQAVLAAEEESVDG